MDPIVHLTGSWRQGGAGRRLAAALRGWSDSDPALRRFDSTEELFRFLRTDPSADRDDVFCALLRRAKQDQLAGLVVLEAVLPGLKRLAGQLLFDGSDRDEVWSLLLANVWEQITSYPVERRPRRVAANLLLDTRKRTLAERDRIREQARRPEAWEAIAPAGLGGSVDLLLDRAAEAGAISRDEAELILATRIDGRPLAEVGAEFGVSYQALLMRRIRAEKRLLFFLGRPVVSFRGRNRHICAARTSVAKAADSASGGAVT